MDKTVRDYKIATSYPTYLVSVLDIKRDKIRKYLFVGNLRCDIYDKDPASLFKHANIKKFIVLHIAMHGTLGKLAFINNVGSKMKQNDIVENILKSCDGPEGSDGSIQCVILNG